MKTEKAETNQAAEILFHPAKWHPKRTYPRLKVPSNRIQFPSTLTNSEWHDLKIANLRLQGWKI
ncbi:MAG TPA: hypothetical protein VJM50_21105 [Pyrinomonadaceae bacterium]|nr:hypothetical protein [Pyrinomonadaceae bacterium]